MKKLVLGLAVCGCMCCSACQSAKEVPDKSKSIGLVNLQTSWIQHTDLYRDWAVGRYGDCTEWEHDGERFMSDDFVQEYAQSGMIPLLNDGRPELINWLYGTVATSVFCESWDSESRYLSAGSLIQRMLDKYARYDNLEPCVQYLKYLKDVVTVPDPTVPESSW